MSTFSLYEGRVLFDPTMVDDEDPVDTALWRIMANNAIHYADEDAHVRVCFTNAIIARTPTAASTWVRLYTSGTWDHRLRPDGVPYPVRFRIAGSTGTTSETVNFRLVISAPHMAETYGRGGPTTGTNVALASSSSTSAAWLTTSAGPATLMRFTQEQAAEALTTLGTIDAVGGDPVAVETVQMCATVWGRYPGASTIPSVRLNGLYVHEICEGTDGTLNPTD